MGERKHYGEEQAKSQEATPGRQALSKMRAVRKAKLCCKVKALLFAICLREDAETGWCVTGIKKLAADAGLRYASAGFFLPRLQRSGAIQIARRRNRTAFRRVDPSKLETHDKCLLRGCECSPGRKSRKSPFKKGDIRPVGSPNIRTGERLSPSSSPLTSPPIRGAPDGACSPSPALRERVGLAVSETTAGKNSVEGNDGNGTGPVFKQKFMTITREQDEEISKFVADSHQRDAQYDALHRSLKGPVDDPVKEMQRWMETAVMFFES